MGLAFSNGWDFGDNNNARPTLTQTDITTILTLKIPAYNGLDTTFQILKQRFLEHINPYVLVNVSKGLHQNEGMLVGFAHVQLETFVNLVMTRFHVEFIYAKGTAKGDKKKRWRYVDITRMGTTGPIYMSTT